MNKKMKIALFALALIGAGTAAFADWYGDRLLPGPLVVGSNGNAMDTVYTSTFAYPNASTTSGSLTLAWVKSTDIVVATPNTAYTNAVYFKSAAPRTGAIDFWFSGDPGNSVSIAYTVHRKKTS